jgi:hypothetical protein
MLLNEVTEGRGKQVMQFNDFIERLTRLANDAEYPEIATNAEKYKKLGIELFKHGFTYDDGEFYKLPVEGGVWEFELPLLRNENDLRMGYVTCHYAHSPNKGQLYRFLRTMTLSDIEMITLNSLFNYMKERARPV